MTSSRRTVARAWAPAVAYMLLIWIASSIATPISLEEVPFRDKGVHFVEYGLLCLLLLHAMAGTWPQLHGLRRALFAVLGTLLWGMLDEIHQAYVPGRNADIGDVVADGLGAIIGAGLFAAYRALRARRANRN